MTKAEFVDESTISVIVRDGETFTVKTYYPIRNKEEQISISNFLAHSFEKNFSDDKTSMTYWVLMDCLANGLAYYSATGDRNKERKRIGARIRQLREEKGIEAKHLATLANIDAANLSRIESGSYSIGLDVLSRIADVLGVKVDLV